MFGPFFMAAAGVRPPLVPPLALNGEFFMGNLMNLPHQSRRLEGVSPQAARAAFGPTVPAG
ncbi:MAG: hypothetical protein DI629_20890 [Mesorhizobium amorphae]|nr:MAG: hypothetical protein DI629_20890 [Mesorhizobium amorphae]